MEDRLLEHHQIFTKAKIRPFQQNKVKIFIKIILKLDKILNFLIGEIWQVRNKTGHKTILQELKPVQALFQMN